MTDKQQKTIRYVIDGETVATEPFNGDMPRVVAHDGESYIAGYWPTDTEMVCVLTLPDDGSEDDEPLEWTFSKASHPVPSDMNLSITYIDLRIGENGELYHPVTGERLPDIFEAHTE